MRAFRWLALISSIALFTVACSKDASPPDGGSAAGSGGAGLTSVTFRLDWIVDGSHTCFYAALDKGYFQQQGLDVQILEGAGSGTAATLVANGSNTFGFSDAGVVAKTINDGADIKMVAGIFQRSPAIIMSLKSSNITTPGDLVGKSVGGTAGEGPLQLLPAYLKANNVDPTQVKVVNIDPAAKIPALLEKRVDSIVAYSSSDLPVAEGQAPGQLNVQHYADFGVVTLSNGIITSNQEIAEHPDVVQGFVTAVQQGFDYCQQNPDDAVKLLVDRFPQTVNPDQAKVALSEVIGNLHTDRTKDKPVGYMDPADWDDTLATLEQYAGLTGVQQADTYYTNEFIKTS